MLLSSLFAGWLLFNTHSPNNASKEHSLALQVTTNLRQTLWKHHFEISLAGRITASSHDSSENYCFCLLHLMNFLWQLQSSLKHCLCFRRRGTVLAFTPKRPASRLKSNHSMHQNSDIRHWQVQSAFNAANPLPKAEQWCKTDKGQKRPTKRLDFCLIHYLLAEPFREIWK